MSETSSLKESTGANPAWLAVPLVVFALIALTVGLVARQTVREPYATPFFHPFFTDTLPMKAWLVTAAVVLACGQILTAARIYELLRFPPTGRFSTVSIAGRDGLRSCLHFRSPTTVSSCSGSVPTTRAS